MADRLIAFDLKMKVAFPVDSAISANSSADCNNASMFAFIIFFQVIQFILFFSFHPLLSFNSVPSCAPPSFSSLHLGMFGTSVLQNQHSEGAL